MTQLCIEYFLAPNLALLIDTMAGSEMQKLGPNILKRLHDPNWEVRDSAIELLTTVANFSIYSEYLQYILRNILVTIAYISKHPEFTAFQEHIVSNGLCRIIVQIAQNDAEPYTRASALACLSQMVLVDIYWETCLSSINIIVTLN